MTLIAVDNTLPCHAAVRIDVTPDRIVAVALSACRRQLRFRLLKQQLLELVRRGETEEALDFAAERLAPEGAGDPAMLREIEEAVTLLAFKVFQSYGHHRPAYARSDQNMIPAEFTEDLRTCVTCFELLTSDFGRLHVGPLHQHAPICPQN